MIVLLLKVKEAYKVICKKFVCLFIYLVILDENFNVTIFFGLLNETNLLLN